MPDGHVSHVPSCLALKPSARVRAGGTRKDDRAVSSLPLSDLPGPLPACPAPVATPTSVRPRPRFSPHASSATC
ncbi:hypothetical protein ACQF36_02845 [Streptomyces sp. Marseille-Q5077]|uniref:hypothetical protein n=1 Tax=Streptomyces sp. Marseille-Q5077 TaxID=3418995 RepID=UPI003D037525